MKNYKFQVASLLALLVCFLFVIAGCGSGGGETTTGGTSTAVTTVAVVAGATQATADGSTKTKYTATVNDANGDPVADGTSVTFSTTAGGFDTTGSGSRSLSSDSRSYNSEFARGAIVSSYTTTTTDGKAFAWLVSPTNTGTAIVTVSANGVSAQKEETFTSGVVSTITLSSSTNNIAADGTSTAIISAEVKDPNGNFIDDNTVINFYITSGGGSLSASNAKTVSGVASLTYTAATSSGTVAFSVESTNGVTATLNLTLVTSSVSSIALTAGAKSITANGISTVSLSAKVLDSNSVAIVDGTTVTFVTTAGSLSAATATTTNGTASVILTSPTLVGLSIITASASGVSTTATVNFTAGEAAAVTVSASPANLTADGTSESTITATVTDTNGNPVTDGNTCSFSVNDGKLSALTASNTSGVATVTYTAPNYVPTGGNTTITVRTTNGITATTVMTLIGSQIDSISLAASPISLPADGSSTANITATVSVPGGSSAPDGTAVTFSIYKFSVSGASGGSITSSANSSGGKAYASLTSGTTSGTATIRAEAGGRTAELTVAYTPGSVTLTIVPNSLLGTGSTANSNQSTVTATVKNASGTLISGATVNFTMDDISLGNFSASSAVTTAAGEAIVTFTESAKGGTAKVTATWTTGGVDVTGTENITISAPPAFIEVAEDSPNPSSINIKGTGGDSTSIVTFDIKDLSGNLVADGYKVYFVIESSPEGGEAIQPIEATTANGKVSTILRSGYKSGPVSIKATYERDSNVTTTVSQIAINAGPPVGEEFSIAAAYKNISGLRDLGLQDAITISAGDYYGNAIPNNTAISFKTYNTGGLFSPTNTGTTTGGIATSTLISSSSPTPSEGFLTVTGEANNGGRTTHVTSLAFVANADTAKHILYAGTDGGGIYKSTDSGISWNSISRSTSNSKMNLIDPYINDIAIKANNPNIIYAATGYLGDGNVYRSMDGGGSWNSDNTEEWNGMFSSYWPVDKDGNDIASMSATLTVLTDNTGDYLWIGTNGTGVFYSADGDKFIQASTNLTTGKVVRDLVRASDTGTAADLYAGTSSGVYKSINGGVDWTKPGTFVGENINVLELHPADPDNYIYAGTQDAGFFYSVNGGTAWTAYNTGLGYGLSATDPEAASTNTGNGTMSSVAVVTNTITENWTATCTTAGGAGTGIFAVTGSVSGLQATSATVGTEYTSPNGFVKFTITGGDTNFAVGDEFTFKTTRDPGVKIKDLLIFDTGGAADKLYAITYFFGSDEAHAVGQVYYLDIHPGTGVPVAGASWTQANTNLPQYDPPDDTTLFPQHVFATDSQTAPAYLYIGGEGINFYKATTNALIEAGTPTWTESKTGLTNLIMTRMPVLFTGESSLDLSAYGGATTATAGGVRNNLFDASNFGGTNVWAVGDQGIILYYDYSDWSLQTSGTTNALYGVDAVSATTAFAVGLGGTILKTTDGGTTWTAETSGVTTALRVVDAVDADVAYAVGDSGVIRKRTLAGGSTWALQTSGVTTTLYSVHAFNATTAIAVGDGGVILYTADSGTTWTPPTAAATVRSLGDVYMLSATEAFAVGDNGTILKTANANAGAPVGAGATWAVQTSGTTNGLNAVYAETIGGNVWVAGETGTMLTTTDGGTNWTFDASNTINNLNGLSANNATNIFVAGNTGTVQFYNGTSWSASVKSTDGGLFGSSNVGNGIISIITGSSEIVGPSITDLWTITFTDDTDFTVSGLMSGDQSCSGTDCTIDSTTGKIKYISDNSTMGFTIEAGTTDFVVGDTFTFYTYRSNTAASSTSSITSSGDSGATLGPITTGANTVTERWVVEMTSATAFKATGSISGLQSTLGTFMQATTPAADAGNTGNGTMSAVSTSPTTTTASWTITLTAATTFDVDKDGAAASPANGNTGVAYTDDSNEVSFTVSVGFTPFENGDEFTFSTSAASSTTYTSDSSEVAFTITNGIPVLATGDAFTFATAASTEGTVYYRTYIHDANGNPPIAGTKYEIVHYVAALDKTYTLYEVTYPDTYTYGATYRDRTNPITNRPLSVTGSIGTNDTITHNYTPLCTPGTAPGCSGSAISLMYGPY